MSDNAPAPTARANSDIQPKHDPGRSMRLAVAEIGSSSVRTLISEISEVDGFFNVKNGRVPIDVLTLVRNGNAVAALGEIERALKIFHEKAKEYGAERTVVFGTEAIRLLRETASTKAHPILKTIEILDDKSEAFYSFVAAAKGFGQPSRTNYSLLVIDQGQGSIEFAVGRASPPIELHDYTSSNEFGVGVLTDYLISNGRNVNELFKWVRAKTEKFSFHYDGAPTAVLQGSVPTKCGWLQVQRFDDEPYQPDRVQGVLVSTVSLLSRVREIGQKPASAWGAWRAKIDPAHPKSIELEKTIAGSIALYLLLGRLGVRNFRVSIHGTRHGRAWKLAGFA